MTSEPALVRPYVLAHLATTEMPTVEPHWPTLGDLHRAEFVERRLSFLHRVLERLRAL